MKYRLHLVALGMAAALLFPAGPANALAEDLEAGDIVIEDGVELDIEAPDMPEDIGSLSLNDLTDALDAPTPAPTIAPTKEPKPEEEKPAWYSSTNYPKGKVFFENEIWRILTAKWGLTDFQAAGLMSSIQAESSFCPYNVQGMGGSDDRGAYTYNTGDSVGFGLCQWTSSGRKAALQSYASAHGGSKLVWDFDTQMGFMAQEVDMAVLKACKTLYEAAEWAVMRYERPNQRYANSWPGTRYEKGKEIYRRHTGKAYEETALSFSVRSGDLDALTAGRLKMNPDTPVILTVSSNYYWRLTQVDSTVENWLDIRCAAFYFPTRQDPCVCGYACEGEKTLTLRLAENFEPEPGQKYSTTLSFEIYRGKHVVKTVVVGVDFGK